MSRIKGFTLIELMIVIAIIGILAAIALPAYDGYVGRSQAVEGFKLTSGLRDDIASVVADTNASSLDGKYVQNGGVTVTADTGVITVLFDQGVISGSNMQLIPTFNNTNRTQLIQWQCGGTLNSKYLPSSCQP